MYIFLDESYNLKDRVDLQFISINGFAVLDVKALFKKWKEYRRPFVGKRRIHAVDSAFDKLKLKTLRLIRRHDLILLTAFQIIQEIPFQKGEDYFRKGKLNFEKVYIDLLKSLFSELSLEEYRNVTIVIDSRKHKGATLGRKRFRDGVMKFLKQKYPDTRSSFEVQPSSTNILLELADFTSNIFYRAYIKQDKKFFEDLQFKMVQIKNPL